MNAYFGNGLNRSSEASKVGVPFTPAARGLASIAPQRHRKAPLAAQHGARARASIAPQRHRKAAAPRPAGGAPRRPQSLLRGIERRYRRSTASSTTRPQSLLRGIERRPSAMDRSVVRIASIAPQRHRKDKDDDHDDNLLWASIAPQRHRKLVLLRAGGRGFWASIAPQRHRKAFDVDRRVGRGLASIAPQRHRKRSAELIMTEAAACLNRSSEASKGGGPDERRHRRDGLNRSSEASKARSAFSMGSGQARLNRSSEASKGAEARLPDERRDEPQSLLRGIERCRRRHLLGLALRPQSDLTPLRRLSRTLILVANSPGRGAPRTAYSVRRTVAHQTPEARHVAPSPHRPIRPGRHCARRARHLPRGESRHADARPAPGRRRGPLSR